MNCGVETKHKINFSYKPITGLYGEKLDRAFGIKNCLWEYQPGNYVMPPQFADLAGQIFDFEVRMDDVWVMSYARTGSTWCQEMVWLIGNDLDFEGANRTIQQLRAPVLEMSSILVIDEYKKFMESYGNSVSLLNKYASPRYIKTHLPVDFLPLQIGEVKPKIIYVARNPKDVCVSYYHHCQLLHGLCCTFEEFCDLFLHGKVPLGPIWPHYLGFWRKKDEEHMLFLRYEDMKKDPRAVIRRIANHLEKSLSEEQVDALHNHLSFHNMKNNRSVNFQTILDSKITKRQDSGDFIRKGQIGDWKNFMTPEMAEKFDVWIAEHCKASGLYF